MGLLVAAITVCFNAYNAYSASESGEEKPFQLVPLSASNLTVSSTAQVDESGERPYTPPTGETFDEMSEKLNAPLEGNEHFFHFVMMSTAMYMAMLCTNWGSALQGPEQNVTTEAYDLGWASTWVKIVSQWATILLYIWTLVAPRLFPDRDFGVDISD